jgi:RHS repeat-associated protein
MDRARDLLNREMPAWYLPFYEKDATYRYYLHGPLARVELGDIEVQGVDYTYTLQGWLKGVNSNTLDATRDPGQDGLDAQGPHVGRDAFGFSLSYFRGDYTAINETMWNTVSNRFEAEMATSSNLSLARNDLWNGNIGSMVTALPLSSNGSQGMAYTYDQLNRLISAKGFQNVDLLDNEWDYNVNYADHYANSFTYDANGNIDSQHRSGEDSTNDEFDALTYKYKKDDDNLPLQNRLYHVNDGQANDAMLTDDIDDQGTFQDTDLGDPNDPNDDILIEEANNYGYDELGQLVRDDAEEIENILWRVDGKITAVIRTSSSDKKSLRFSYDAMGNRVAKYVYSDPSFNSQYLESTTYYLRDAQGNVMTVYNYHVESEVGHLELREQHIYGSSRLGMRTPKAPDILGVSNPDDDGLLVMERGLKQYELSNHLGNVLVVVSDQKIAIDNIGQISHYEAEILSYTDYYPFGSVMSERTGPAGSEYRYGFNGMERVDEFSVQDGSYDFGARIYDGRLARWWSVDDLVRAYPGFTSYSYSGNCPILLIDPDGNRIVIHYQDDKGRNKKVVLKKAADLDIVHSNGFVNETITQLKSARDLGMNEVSDIISHAKKLHIYYGRGENSVGGAEYAFDAKYSRSGKNEHRIVWDPAYSTLDISLQEINLMISWKTHGTRYLKEVMEK